MKILKGKKIEVKHASGMFICFTEYKEKVTIVDVPDGNKEVYIVKDSWLHGKRLKEWVRLDVKDTVTPNKFFDTGHRLRIASVYTGGIVKDMGKDHPVPISIPEKKDEDGYWKIPSVHQRGLWRFYLRNVDKLPYMDHDLKKDDVFDELLQDSLKLYYQDILCKVGIDKFETSLHTAIKDVFEKKGFEPCSLLLVIRLERDDSLLSEIHRRENEERDREIAHEDRIIDTKRDTEVKVLIAGGKVEAVQTSIDKWRVFLKGEGAMDAWLIYQVITKQPELTERLLNHVFAKPRRNMELGGMTKEYLAKTIKEQPESEDVREIAEKIANGINCDLELENEIRNDAEMKRFTF